jgi:hypothetical protein
MVSSGDAAAATCDDTAETPQAAKGATVSYPASIPEITSVGGTEFNENAGTYWNTVNGVNRGSALSYIPERVWNDSAFENAIVGGGGGASAFFTKPSWQSGPGVPNDNARDVPDVALAASADHDGFAIVSSGFNYVVGGTSVSSPVFAGMVALINQFVISKQVQAQAGLGNINPALYRMAQTTTDVFHDIAVGDNMVECVQGSPNCVNNQLGYAAGPGYDLASGLGSVDAFNLVNEWNAGSASTTTLSATPASVAPGDSVVLTATVAGGGGVPSGSVNFGANGASLGSATLAPGTKSATASLKVSGAQIVSGTIAAGTGTVAAAYSGDQLFAPSTGSASIGLKPGSGSYVVPSVSPNPVYAAGGVWSFGIVLNEKAGVGTTLTGLTINGINSLNLFRRTAIAPNGSIAAFGSLGSIAAPLNVPFHFAGMDGNGQAWAQDLAIAFLPADRFTRDRATESRSRSVVPMATATDGSGFWRVRR